MRNANKGIYLFIQEQEKKKNRELAQKQKADRIRFLRADQEPTEQLAAPSDDTCMPVETCEEETTAVSEKMTLEDMHVNPGYRPFVFLRCKKCGTKTDHVLRAMKNDRKEYVEQTYECQECGETRTIYELVDLM